MHKNKEIEIRSEEVQEILTRIPNWTIRWGTVVISGIILTLFFFSWLIKYPDLVIGQILITTNTPPEKVIAKISGKIETILVPNKTNIIENTPLAIIQNTANYKDVFLLKKILQEYTTYANFDFKRLENTQLGDIESAYAAFHIAYTAYELNIDLKPFQVEGNAQNIETTQITTRLNLLEQQKKLNENELLLQKTDLNRYQTLFNKGIISMQDFENRKLIYIQAEKGQKTLLSNISLLKSNLNDNLKTRKSIKINETTEGINLESNKTKAYHQLKKVINDWELEYVLKSSVAGKVSFLQIWIANQTINAGENIFSIIPSFEKGYIGKLKAPALNSGKIKIGQEVNIRLTNFPDTEFGMVRGKIQDISLTPDKDGYLWIDVSLPQKLETTYHKLIPFQQEMSGTAEIITQDLRLIERLLYQFKDLFKRN